MARVGQGAQQDISAQAAQVVERRALCWEYKKAGMSLRQIATQVGISHEAVRQHIRAAYREWGTRLDPDEIAQYRAVELEAIDEEIAVLHHGVVHGDWKAGPTLVALRRLKMEISGYAAPKQYQGVTGMSEAERKALDAELLELIVKDAIAAGVVIDVEPVSEEEITFDGNGKRGQIGPTKS